MSDSSEHCENSNFATTPVRGPSTLNESSLSCPTVEPSKCSIQFDSPEEFTRAKRNLFATTAEEIPRVINEQPLCIPPPPITADSIVAILRGSVGGDDVLKNFDISYCKEEKELTIDGPCVFEHGCIRTMSQMCENPELFDPNVVIDFITAYGRYLRASYEVRIQMRRIDDAAPSPVASPVKIEGTEEQTDQSSAKRHKSSEAFY